MEKPLKILLVEDTDAKEAVRTLVKLGFIGPQIGHREVWQSDGDVEDYAADVIHHRTEWCGVDIEVAKSLGEACSYIESVKDGPAVLLCDIRLRDSGVGLPERIRDILIGEADVLDTSGRSRGLDDRAGLYLWALYGKRLQERECHVFLYSAHLDVLAEYKPFTLKDAQPRLFKRASEDSAGRVGWDFLEVLDEPLAASAATIVRHAPNRVADVLSLRSAAREALELAADTSVAADTRESRVRDVVARMGQMPIAETEAINVFVPWILRALVGRESETSLRTLVGQLCNMPLVQMHLDDLYHEFCKLENIAHTRGIADFVSTVNDMTDERRSDADRQLTSYLDALEEGIDLLRRLEKDLAYGSSDTRGTCTRLRATFQELEDALAAVRRRSRTNQPQVVTGSQLEQIDTLAGRCKEEVDLIYKPQVVVRQWVSETKGVTHGPATGDVVVDSAGKLDGMSRPKLTVVPDLLRQLLANWLDNTRTEIKGRIVGVTRASGGRHGELVIELSCASLKMTKDQMEVYGTIDDMNKADIWAKGYGSCRIADLHGGYIRLISDGIVRDSRSPSTSDGAERAASGTIQEVHLPFISPAKTPDELLVGRDGTSAGVSRGAT